VSGVGPKLTLSVLSGLGATGLSDTIAGGDVGRLVRVPGIGKKTAERLVMELRDKFKAQAQKMAMGPGGKLEPGKRLGAGGGSLGAGGPFADVVGALCNLGYKAPDAERAVEKVLGALSSGATGASGASGAAGAMPPIEEVLRQSLRALQRD
jgi:Holliday junction DNA helicase RuvA